MSKNNNNTPRLRFPGFTGEWEERLVKDICNINTGKSNTQDQVEDGLYPFYIRSATPVRSNRYLYDCEAVITIGDGQIGKVFHYVNGKFDLHQRCYMMSNFKDVDCRYFYYFFSNNFYNRAIRLSAKGTVDSVRLEMISDMPIFLPPTLEEQQKIAECLMAIDDQISAQSQKVEALKEKKKGMMQQLLPQKGETTPRLRFPGFTGEWEEKRLKEIFVLRNGYTPLKGEDSYWTDGEIPWFRMEDIREKGNVLYDSTQHITQKAIKGKGCFNANTIILATSATIGEHALIKVAHLANQRFVNLEINPMYSREISIEYAYYYMYIIDEICKSIGNIGTFASVSTEALSNLLFVYPSTFAEQQKIADCLSELDDLIASETKQLESLKDHKKGLMQQLFPQPAK